MKRPLLFVSVLLSVLVIVPSFAFSAPITLEGGDLLFPETGKVLRGMYLDYWSAHGGLAQFGFPISNANDREDREFSYQYFERALMEVWFDPSGSATMKLALLGSELTKGRQGEPPFQRVDPVSSSSDFWYFPETGHMLSYGFLNYWLSHGGLEIYGYPISQEFVEVSPTDGKEYTVQYFERNRFEYHPENKGTPFEVQLGLLGSEYYRIEPNPFSVGLNTPQGTGLLTVTINSVRRASSYETFVDPPQGYEYLMVNATIENIGSEQVWVSEWDFELRDQGGQQYQRIWGGGGTIMAGDKLTIDVVWRLPIGQEASKLYFQRIGDDQIRFDLDK